MTDIIDKITADALDEAMRSDGYKECAEDFSLALATALVKFGAHMYREGLKDGLGIREGLADDEG